MGMNSIFWFKALGCLMVFVGCTGTGLRMSSRLAERQRVLYKLSEILLNLKNLICSLGTPLSASFDNIGKESIGGVWSDIFNECSRIMNEQHRDAGSAWKDALHKHRDQLPLSESDFTALNDFGELLGKSDRASQESVIDMERDKIAVLEKKAREMMDTKGKLYRNLGALTGAAVVILLI